jgi:hypothetical protein
MITLSTKDDFGQYCAIVVTLLAVKKPIKNN